jgi:Tol biopolymer transport system component
MCRPTAPPLMTAAVALMVSLATACQDQGPEPALGAAQVTVTTTGADVDPDGYTLNVDRGTAQPIAVNGSMTVPALTPGSHSVLLGGTPANCTVGGTDPRTVSVSAGETAHVDFVVTCAHVTGGLQVTTVTTGADLDPDGYLLTGDSIPQQPIATNGTVTFSGLSSGTRQLVLAGIASNCTLAGSNPLAVDIPAGGVAQVTFQLTCSLTGSISVAVATAGVALDPDGYAVSVHNTETQPIAVNGTVTFGGLVVGSYSVTLGGVAANCSVAGANVQTAIVTGGTTVAVSFSVTCRPGTQLAFVSVRDGNAEIYLINSDRSGLVRLTDNPAADYEPAWSPDGARIAFTSNRDGNDEVYVMNADGSNVVRLTNDPADDEGPVWSPDGSRIAFQSTRDGNAEIYVMNADGSGLTRLTSDPAADFDPAWSPDGSRIAFASYRDDGSSHIYVMKADGSGEARLTTDPAWDVSPAWSPDGSKIAFMNVDGAGLYLINADGSNPTLVPNAYGQGPRWSPDGANIAFYVIDEGAGDIWVVNLAGNNLVSLTVDGTSFEPDWRPRVP